MKTQPRIGIDGSFLSGQARGHARYTIELCKALDKLLPHACFYVYCPVEIDLPVKSDRWVLRVGGSHLAFSPIVWLKMYCGHLCKQDGLDVFWGIYNFLPHLPASVKTITTVYDLTYKVTPGTFPFFHEVGFKLFLKSDLKKADAVISCSQASADRIEAFVGRKVTAIVPGVEEMYTPQSQEKIKACEELFDIRAPYLLNVATWEPRKNVDFLVHTFIHMKEQGFIPEYQLVLVGKKGWRYDDLEAIVTQHEDIVWLDYIQTEDLLPLYSGADLFVFPSLYEGFGMPVLEAHACGTRSVTTNIPELREAGGPDSLYIELNQASLAQGILQGLERKLEPLTMTDYATWEDQAKKILDVLTNIIPPSATL